MRTRQSRILLLLESVWKSLCAVSVTALFFAVLNTLLHGSYTRYFPSPWFFLLMIVLQTYFHVSWTLQARQQER